MHGLMNFHPGEICIRWTQEHYVSLMFSMSKRHGPMAKAAAPACAGQEPLPREILRRLNASIAQAEARYAAVSAAWPRPIL